MRNALKYGLTGMLSVGALGGNAHFASALQDTKTPSRPALEHVVTSQPTSQPAPQVDEFRENFAAYLAIERKVETVEKEDYARADKLLTGNAFELNRDDRIRLLKYDRTLQKTGLDTLEELDNSERYWTRIGEVERAAGYMPSVVNAEYNLGSTEAARIKLGKGSTEKARKHYERALELLDGITDDAWTSLSGKPMSYTKDSIRNKINERLKDLN